jgi:hypothetical protein
VRWTALMAIHGAVHFPANLGVKYTWVGPGYLSNVYYKMIANKPMYRFDRGGDMSFGYRYILKGIKRMHPQASSRGQQHLPHRNWRL